MSTPPHRHVRPELNHRIELVSMDRFLDEITIGLYLVGGDRATIHSYSARPGVQDRLAWLGTAMCVLGGMETLGLDDRTVAFRCGSWHELAARRAFLEACKIEPTTVLASRPGEVDDLRTGHRVVVSSLGQGGYRVATAPLGSSSPATVSERAAAVAIGLAKLAALDADEADQGVVRFSCGVPHDELVGLLLPRAINVRAALREQEMATARGLLVAPSAQASAGA